MLNNLRELGKKFPTDGVLRSMIKEETKQSRTVKNLPTKIPQAIKNTLMAGFLQKSRSQSAGPEKTLYEQQEDRKKLAADKEMAMKVFINKFKA
jgi:hypothetical protein